MQLKVQNVCTPLYSPKMSIWLGQFWSLGLMLNTLALEYQINYLTRLLTFIYVMFGVCFIYPTAVFHGFLPPCKHKPVHHPEKCSKLPCSLSVLCKTLIALQILFKSIGSIVYTVKYVGQTELKGCCGFFQEQRRWLCSSQERYQIKAHLMFMLE